MLKSLIYENRVRLLLEQFRLLKHNLQLAIFKFAFIFFFGGVTLTLSNSNVTADSQVINNARIVLEDNGNPERHFEAIMAIHQVNNGTVTIVGDLQKFVLNTQVIGHQLLAIETLAKISKSTDSAAKNKAIAALLELSVQEDSNQIRDYAYNALSSSIINIDAYGKHDEVLMKILSNKSDCDFYEAAQIIAIKAYSQLKAETNKKMSKLVPALSSSCDGVLTETLKTIDRINIGRIDDNLEAAGQVPLSKLMHHNKDKIRYLAAKNLYKLSRSVILDASGENIIRVLTKEGDSSLKAQLIDSLRNVNANLVVPFISNIAEQIDQPDELLSDSRHMRLQKSTVEFFKDGFLWSRKITSSDDNITDMTHMDVVIEKLIRLWNTTKTVDSGKLVLSNQSQLQEFALEALSLAHPRSLKKSNYTDLFISALDSDNSFNMRAQAIDLLARQEREASKAVAKLTEILNIPDEDSRILDKVANAIAKIVFDSLSPEEIGNIVKYIDRIYSQADINAGQERSLKYLSQTLLQIKNIDSATVNGSAIQNLYTDDNDRIHRNAHNIIEDFYFQKLIAEENVDIEQSITSIKRMITFLGELDPKSNERAARVIDLKEKIEKIQLGLQAQKVNPIKPMWDSLPPLLQFGLFILGLYIFIWMPILALLFYFTPLRLIRLNYYLHEFGSISLPEALGGYKIVHMRKISCINLCCSSDRVLDAWVNAHIGYASTAFEKIPGVISRKHHIDTKVILKNEEIDVLSEDDLNVQGKWRILIAGIGGLGKTSLAYKIARWGISGKLAPHKLIPLILPVELKFNIADSTDAINDSLKCLTEELAKFLNVADSRFITEELVGNLLKRQRVMVIADGLTERKKDSSPTEDYPILKMLLEPKLDINALVVTARKNPFSENDSRILIHPKGIDDGDVLARFIASILKNEYPQDDYQRILKRPGYLVLVNELQVMFESEDTKEITPLIAKMYARFIWVTNKGGTSSKPSSIPKLMADYIYGFNRNISDEKFRNIKSDAKKVAWLVVKKNLVPEARSRQSLIRGLGAGSDATKRLDILEKDIQIIQKTGNGEDDFIYTLDPLAEYLAALYLIDDFKEKSRIGDEVNQKKWEELWGEFLERDELQNHGDTNVLGFTVALYDCCKTVRSSSAPLEWVAKELHAKIFNERLKVVNG